MTLFSRVHATKVLAALAVLALAGSLPTQAGDRDGRHHHRFKPHAKHYVPSLNRLETGLKVRQRIMKPANDPGRSRRDFNSSGFYAYEDTGNGFTLVKATNGMGDLAVRSREKRKTLQIITVTPGPNGCSMEAGVCVIRP